MKILIKLMKVVFDIIVLLCIGFILIVLYNFYQISILDKKYSEFFGYTFFEVTTGSMKDTININDVIIVKITQDVHKNDIVSYMKNEEIITHRIIEENGTILVTKGDSNNSADMPIERNTVIGKVEKIIPELGVWIKVFSDFKVTISIVITFLLFGLALSSKEKRNKKNRHSFSRFLKNLKGMLKNGKEKETKD
ncbi:MAG: signal peptidase I [Clostridia bacterium]|nr:signal peptidase I [Clostridia bacterium]